MRYAIVGLALVATLGLCFYLSEAASFRQQQLAVAELARDVSAIDVQYETSYDVSATWTDQLFFAARRILGLRRACELELQLGKGANRIRPEYLRAMASSVQRVTISSEVVDYPANVTDLSALATLPNLESVRLENCVPDDLDWLARWKSVRLLDVHEAAIEHDDEAYLVELLRDGQPLRWYIKRGRKFTTYLRRYGPPYRDETVRGILTAAPECRITLEKSRRDHY